MTTFEELPTELIGTIMSHLESIELLPLLAVSPGFMDYMIDVLDRRGENGKNMAMRWACLNGYLPIIRSLVSRGAPVSTVDIEWKHCEWDRSSTQTAKWVEKKAKVLTLHLAATRKQVQAFGFLIELGARIDCSGLEKAALRRLMNRICNPVDNWALLRLFYEHKLHSQICFAHYPQLERVIRRHPISEIGWPVYMLLDRGIDPNGRCNNHRHTHATPLVVAIQLNSEPMVDLLVSRGACINGPNSPHPKGKPWPIPWPIPILAAAESMSRNGPKMMKACLRHGANVNYYTRRTVEGSEFPRRDYYITPFWVYLNSISHWGQHDHAINPVQAIGFLIEQGAWVEQPAQSPFQDPSDDWKTPFTWGVEYLLRRWGLMKLETSACFRATIYRLLQQAVRNGNLGESLARYKLNRWNTKPEDLTKWQELLTYLLNVQQVDPTQLLYDYLIHKARLSENLQYVGEVTVDHLLSAGAHIHARLQPNGTTVLEELCRTYNNQYHETVESHRGTPCKPFHRAEEMIKFLVSRGINSSVETPVTIAIDFLHYGLGNMRTGNCVNDVTRILRGEK